MQHKIKSEKIIVYAKEEKRCLSCKRLIAAGDQMVGEMIQTPFYTTIHYICGDKCYELYKVELQLCELGMELHLKNQNKPNKP